MKIFIGAVVVGAVVGAGAGYTVQATRPPTPLPALAGAQPTYPPSNAQSIVLPAGQDDASTLGDLTKALLSVPADATPDAADRAWMSQATAPVLCDTSATCFTDDVTKGVAHSAQTGWKRDDGVIAEISIVQYAPGQAIHAAYEDSPALGSALPLPDGPVAAGYEFTSPSGADEDVAVAAHGDVLVYFWVAAAGHAPDPAIIDDLIVQQMARL
jgi:hypothetical protein